jgi:hypothetical protein
MKRYALLLTIFIVCCISSSVYAQEITTRIDKNQFQVNEPFSVKYEVKAKVDSMHFSGLKHYEIVGGPNQSNSMVTMGGQTKFTFGITYFFKAKKKGKLALPSPIFYSEGREIKAEKVKIKVTKNANAPKKGKKNKKVPEQKKETEPLKNVRYS